MVATSKETLLLVSVTSRAALRAWFFAGPALMTGLYALISSRARQYGLVSFATSFGMSLLLFGAISAFTTKSSLREMLPPPANYLLKKASVRDEDPLILARVPVGVAVLVIIAFLVPETAGGMAGIVSALTVVHWAEVASVKRLESKLGVTYGEPARRETAPYGWYLCPRPARAH